MILAARCPASIRFTTYSRLHSRTT